MKNINIWQHVGGGCMVVGGEKYPADDGWENIKTKQYFGIACTQEAHSEIPMELKSLKTLLSFDISPESRIFIEHLTDEQCEGKKRWNENKILERIKLENKDW